MTTTFGEKKLGISKQLLADQRCQVHIPLRQFVLIRNIRFQSWASSAAMRLGRNLVSRPSLRPMKPLEPLKRSLPNSRK